MTSTGSSDRLRICLVGSGASIHLRRWAADLAARRCEVAILSHGVAARLEGVTLHRIRPAPPLIRQLTAAADARRFLRAFRPEIVHVHYVDAGPRALWPLGFGRLVVSPYGTDVEGIPGGLRGFVARRVLAAVLRRADAVVAASRHLMGRTLDVGLARPNAITEVIGFGVDCSRFPATDQRSTDGEVVVGYAKGLRTYYGAMELIEAVDRLVREGRPVRLRMAGSGPLEADLRAEVARRGLEGRVELLGNLADDELPRFYAGLDLFAMPSHREAYGVAALEAAASGRAVVATRVGGIGEVVVDGETGLLVPPRDPRALADALRRLADDPGLRRRLGIRGREVACSRHTREGSVERMLELYRRVLAAPHL